MEKRESKPVKALKSPKDRRHIVTVRHRNFLCRRSSKNPQSNGRRRKVTESARRPADRLLCGGFRGVPQPQTPHGRISTISS